MTRVVVRMRYVRPETDADIPLPRYMTADAAGMDIHAAPEQEVILTPGDIRLIPTGFAMALPRGYEAQIRPRSGLAAARGITLVNSPGTIDADYRGEVKVPLINLGRTPFTIGRGDRIAQLVVQPVCRAELEISATLDDTDRSDGGFGHTGY